MGTYENRLRYVWSGKGGPPRPTFYVADGMCGVVRVTNATGAPVASNFVVNRMIGSHGFTPEIQAGAVVQVGGATGDTEAIVLSPGQFYIDGRFDPSDGEAIVTVSIQSAADVMPGYTGSGGGGGSTTVNIEWPDTMNLSGVSPSGAVAQYSRIGPTFVVNPLMVVAPPNARRLIAFEFSLTYENLDNIANPPSTSPIAGLVNVGVAGSNAPWAFLLHGVRYRGDPVPLEWAGLHADYVTMWRHNIAFWVFSGFRLDIRGWFADQ